MPDRVAVTSQDPVWSTLGLDMAELSSPSSPSGAPPRGIEFNPDMVALAQLAARAESVEKLARFERADIFVVFMPVGQTIARFAPLIAVPRRKRIPWVELACLGDRGGP